MSYGQFLKRSRLVADSNGAPVLIEAFPFITSDTPTFKPFYTDDVNIEPGWLQVSPESTGSAYVEFWDRTTRVSDPMYLQPGTVIYTTGTIARIVAVRRGGAMWLQSGGAHPFMDVSTAAQRANFRGMELRTFPVTQIPLIEGSGTLSNIWTHPLCAPGAVNPMVSGSTFMLSSGVNLNIVGHTASHWTSVHIVAFNVVRNPVDGLEYVDNVRRITTNLGTSASAGTLSADVNTWDRFGVLAIPSGTNPGGVAPATQVWCELEAFGVYSRSPEYAFAGVGTKSQLV